MRSSFKFLQLLPKSFSFFRINRFPFARNLKMQKTESDLLPNNPQTKVAETPKTEVSQKAKKTEATPKILKELNNIPINEKPKEKKNKSVQKGIFNQTTDNLKLETILSEFKNSKANVDSGFDIFQHLTFLSDIIKAKKTQAYLSQADVDLKRNIFQETLQIPEVKECILTLKSHIMEMDNHQITNFLALLSKIDYYDEEIISFLSTRIIKKEVKLNSIAISYLIWALAKYRLRNELLLGVLVESLLAQKSKLSPKSQANIFWAVSVLNYKNEDLVKMLEEQILKNSLNFDSTCVNLIFGAYCNTRIPNNDVMDALSMKVLSIGNTFTFRNIANWLNYCATLNYQNMNCFNLFERVLITKIKAFELKQGEKNLKTIQTLEKELISKIKTEAKTKKISISEAAESDLPTETLDELIEKAKVMQPTEENPLENDVLTPFDASQILLSFCKMKIVKPELFEVLEASFVKMLPIANPSSFTAFAYAHSSLCTEMQMKFNENKKYLLKRSVKNLKKYNQMFYELMLPHIKTKLNEFKFEEIYSILLSASRPMVKKRAVCRGLIDMAITALPLLKQNFEKLPKESLEKMIFQYFRVAMNFVFKEEQRINLEKSFQEINIDIRKICVTYGYLIPQAREIELKNDYDEEEKNEAKQNEELKNKEEKKIKEADKKSDFNENLEKITMSTETPEKNETAEIPKNAEGGTPKDL